MKCFIVLFFSVLAMTGYAATTLEVKKDCKDCEVKFEVKLNTGAGFGDFEGKGGKPIGKFVVKKDKVSGEIWVAWSDFDVDFDKRKQHMLETFQAEKYPKVYIRVKDLPAKDGDYSLKAEMALLGKYKPVTGKYSLKSDGDKKKVRAEFDVDFTLWGIEQPSFVGVRPERVVHVILDAVASP